MMVDDGSIEFPQFRQKQVQDTDLAAGLLS